MTLHELLQSMGRRWYVVVVVLGAAVLAAIGFARDGGLYSTRTVVVFTLPGEPTLLPDNGTGDASIIGFAAAVAQEVNGGRPAVSYASADAPSYGAGVRQGVWVGLPNAGGQWTTSFARAEIEIQVVGRTAQWVRQTQQSTLARIETIADGQQIAAGAVETERVTTSIAPLTTQIEYIEATRSSRILAFTAMAVAAVIVSAWLSLLLDRLLSRSHRRTRSVAVVELGGWA